tara:strand:- start:1368 stop:2243 length:876 start_codon:yes stop_codon:yes gene_type:complete
MATSYQSKSKNKPTGQLPSQVRAKMEEERQKILEKARAERTRKKGVKRLQGTAAERATASEFGASMSPTTSKDDKARASKRANPKDLRYTGTDAKNKVLKQEANRRTMAAAAAKRKITQAEAKASKDPRGNQVKATPGTAKKKEAAKKYNVGVSKGGVPFREAFKYYRGQGNKTFTWNGKKYTTDVKKAAPKAKVSTPTPADFSTSAKKDTKSKDPRGNQIKATPGKKGPLASARKEYPVTGPGSQSKILRPKKAADKIPAGAKPFTGSYNSKTHKLQNINGKTYKVPKGK